MRLVELQDYSEDRFFLTELGVDWLMSNQQKLNLKLPSSYAAAPDFADQASPTMTSHSRAQVLRPSGRCLTP